MTPAVLRRVEAMAIRSTERHWGRIPPALTSRLRPSVERVGDGLLTMARGGQSLRRNRVIGLGHRGRAEKAMIDEIVARYRAARLQRFSMLLGPGPQAEAIAGWLAERGFERRRGYSLLMRDCRLPQPRAAARGGLRVARARRRDQLTVVRIHERTFGRSIGQRGWALATAAAPDYEHYLAFVGSTPVGAATLRVDGDLAWLGGGATLPRWRGRGAHGALIAARLRRAAQRGCRWAWCETDAPAPGRPGGSRRNMLRLGFAEACVKPIFVWRER